MRKFLVLLVSIPVFFTACGKLTDLDRKVAGVIQGKVEEKIRDRPPANLAAPALPSRPPIQQDADESLLQELNGYIGCLNRAVPRAEDSYKRYLSWANKTSGPTCKEAYITYGLYSLYDDSVSKCREAADKGRAGGPSLPDLEAAADDLATCNATLVPLVKKADTYYDQQDYRDDACAKGKEMHPQLVATFEKCLETAKKLSDGVDKLKDDLDRRRLAKLDQSGASLQAEVMRVMIGAKDLLKTINAGGKDQLVAKEVYVPKCLEFEKSYQKLDDYATAHKEEVDKTFWGSAFLGSAKSFNGAAKFLRRDLEDGKEPRGEAESFVNSYNSMINDSNNLKFNFGM